MTATRVKTKSKLLYSLPVHPPIPFLTQPAYPIRTPTRDLPTAYNDALWPQAEPKQSEQVVLDSFARLLLALLDERSPTDLNSLVRLLLIPLQDFDKRWRDALPSFVEPREGFGLPVVGSSGLSEEEKAQIKADYDRWAVQEKLRLEEERTSRKGKMTKGKGKDRAQDQDEVMREGPESPEEEEDEIRAGDWLAAKELLETRLQALLLLALLSLPATFQPELPKKGKKKKNPEKYAESLDAAMLLDFLTDRMQIWRVMKDVSDLDFAGLGDSQEGEKTEKVKAEVERDTVQEWWEDVVERLFRTRVDATVLSHHRLKLFPAPSQAERVAQRLAPAPSPFKARSLLSLERSARKRELQEEQKLVTESPTMKRLLSMPSLGGTNAKGKARMLVGPEEEMFKVPGMPSKRRDSAGGDASEAVAERQKSSSHRQPRKQERPRPLPRGDSSNAARDLLKRREISYGKKSATSGVGLKKPIAATKKAEEGLQEVEGRKRKRKSVSPKKLSATSRAVPTLTLVPDTPSKKTSTSAPSGRKPFSRAASLPSFAALGAAFRAGAADAALPPGIPPPPVLPQDRRRDGMDLDLCLAGAATTEAAGSEDEDAWLDGREDDWRKKGGRERQSSYNGDEEEPSQAQSTGLSTPKKPRQALLVPDT
ncbi:hypothetical protein JCM10213_007298 [Rhodosporidiobolus nylandii]